MFRKGVHSMRRNKTVQLFAILILCTITILIGCYQKQELNKDSKITATVTPTSAPVPSLVEEIGISVTELSIYSLALNHKDIESVTALVSSKEITPEVIVDKVVESMEDASFQIKIYSVETQQDTIIVNFFKSSPPVSGVTKETETAILDAVAQSLLDNLADYHKVIYRVEGEAYTSDNLTFTENYVYIEK